MELTQEERTTVRRFVAALAHVIAGEVALEIGDDPPSNIEPELRDLTTALWTRIGNAQAEITAKQAFLDSVENLTANHRIAAAIEIDDPSEDDLASFKLAMDEVHANLVENQRWSAVSSIAGAVADILDDRLA